MRIYSWNVNGLRAVQKKGFVDWVKNSQPDILCLQETKAAVEQLDHELVNIPGYFSFWSSAQRKGYSGVAVYSRIEPLSVKIGIGQDRFDQEGRILSCDYGDFILFNVYFPNGQQGDERLRYKLEFYEAMMEHSQRLREQGRKVIITGDFNTAHHEIDLKNAKANEKTSGFLPVEREYLTRYLNMGFVDVFRHLYPEEIKYTWWSFRANARSRNVGWRIDYFYVSDNMLDLVDDCEIINDVEGSDHCPLVLTLKPRFGNRDLQTM